MEMIRPQSDDWKSPAWPWVIHSSQHFLLLEQVLDAGGREDAECGQTVRAWYNFIT